jgi:hypothetical protein
MLLSPAMGETPKTTGKPLDLAAECRAGDYQPANCRLAQLLDTWAIAATTASIFR